MKNNVSFQICILSIILLIILFIYFISPSVTFFADDLWLGIYEYDEGIFDSLKQHTGGFFAPFITKFLNFGFPNLLNIHPSDFIFQGAAVIKGIIYSAVLLLIAGFVSTFAKSKRIYFAAFISAAAYALLYGLYITHPQYFYINHSFYRYILPLVFFLCFLMHIYKNCLLKPQNINIFYMLFIVFCCCITGTSIEILIYLSLLFTALLMIYNFCVSFIKNEEIKASMMLNIDKNFYIPVFILYTAVILYNFSAEYKDLFQNRVLGNASSFKLYLQEFSNQFFELYIKNEIIVLIVFIILAAVSFYAAYKHRELKAAVLPLLFQFSVISVFFSLIFCGKSYWTKGNFWLVHAALQDLYHILILIGVYMYAGYLFKYIKNKYINLIFLLTAALVYLTVFLNFNGIKEAANKYFSVSEAKIRLYKAEKIMRFYYLKNETPYLPVEFNDTDDEPGAASAYIWKHRFEDYKENSCKTGADITFSSSYYLRIYKYDKALELGYCFSSDAMERFYEAGGSFSADELNNIKFSRLFDENFVLNKK